MKFYRLGRIKMKLIGQDKLQGQNICVKFVNPSLNNSNWDEKSESLIKKSVFQTD